MPIYTLHIPDIVCNACAEPIRNILTECKEVESVEINIVNKTATVTTAETAKSGTELKQILASAVEEIGYPSSEITGDLLEEKISYHQSQHRTVITKQQIRRYWIKGILGVLAGLITMGVCIWGLGISILGCYILCGLSGLLTLYLGKDTYVHATRQLFQNKTLSMELLFTVSTLLALGVSIASFFFPWLPMMFDAPLLILGFTSIGLAIKETAKQRVAKISFRDYAPRQCEVENSNQHDINLVKDLVPGDVIIIRSGKTIPVDGICLNLSTSLYNTRITGRTMPESIKMGDEIYAGAYVPSHVPFIKLRVTKKESDSYLAQLDYESTQAELQKAPIEISTNKVLKYFIHAVFAVAIVSAIVVGVMISPLAALQCGISVLVSACPCTLGLITPLAIKVGLNKALEHGVSFKSGKSIQAAAEIDTVVFDLNGTLTTGCPQIIKSTVPTDKLAQLAALEKDIDHPLARAISQFAASSLQAESEFKVCEVDKSHNTGVVALIDNENYAIGNFTLMQKLGIPVEPNNEVLPGEQIVYFALEHKIIGTIILKDPLRDEAKQTITELQRLGKQIHICTGTDRNTASGYAKELGIADENIHANCLSNTKTAFVKNLIQVGHKVSMVGDAANDASAVGASHFGIAIKSSASDKITQQNAGAAINKASLWPIVNAFTIAKQTTANIKQNLGGSFAYNLLAMVAFSGLLIALGFAINPAIGALLMIVQTGLILMNVERFKHQSVPQCQATTTLESTHRKLSSHLLTDEPLVKSQLNRTLSLPNLQLPKSISYSLKTNGNPNLSSESPPPIIRRYSI